MFKKISASTTEDRRIVRFSYSQTVNKESIATIKNDSVLKTVVTEVQRINNHTVEVTASHIVIGQILDDLWSADPAAFDEWLALELQAAMSPRKPKVVPREKPPRGPFSRMDMGRIGGHR